ncbi:hypothetical protein CARUB_v10022710mg [Capsella rubella]|uniref:DCD domain-containing protein n=1 Tax=Capsella rubella TaxID=81985 RepID=R0FVM9_9BRAS|nr:uncharacterized protein LOC17889151 [Capsella rubella]XP_023639369.1 uncharacterized protein LOC17889151 [Capsella rubella]EOA26646.1 hypothetical protein CARUB_v10022710mg [Capsella rubella]
MELQDAQKDENEKSLEASVAENNGEDVAEAEGKDENELVETSAGEKGKADDDEFVETLMDTDQVLAALKVPVEENDAENVVVKELSLLDSVEASSSGMKKSQGLPAKTKTIKKVKKLVKRKIRKGTTTAVQVAGEENFAVEQGMKEGRTVVNSKEDEQSPEPSLGGSEKEIKKVTESVADSPQFSSGKDKDLENSIGGNIMEFKKNVEELAEAPQPADDGENVAGGKLSGKKTLKQVKGKASILKRQMGKKVKGTLTQGMDKETAAILQGPKDGVDLESIVSDKRDAGASPGGNVMEAKTAIDGSVEAKTGLAEGKRRKRNRQRKQDLVSNKKQRKEVVTAADATEQRKEERKEQLVNPEKGDRDEHGKVKIGGLIFMCNTKTRPDCFRFSVMGVQEKKKDYVMGIKPGLKLFLYDYDLKLLYGIFQASSAGGMKLERKAFGGSFPAQVRFKIFSDCLPLPESQFRKAIKENYNNNNKFKTELTHKQVFKLKKLFRPAAIPAQLTHTQPIPVPRDADRKRSDRDRYAPSSSRAHPTRTHERRRDSPPPRREEQPRDLYLSEREYRTYGLRRGDTTQHYPTPPPDSSYDIVNRDRVRLDSYRSSVDHDRLLRQAEIERHDRREVRLVHLPDRDYHMYDHQSSRRGILGRNSPNPPTSAVALDSYRRDPHYSYEYERPSRTYMASPRREDDDLYSRYITADSLAEYYRSSQRYPSVTESELPPSLVTSRYAYPRSLPYPHR